MGRMKRAPEFAPRDNGETLDKNLEGKLSRRCVGNYIDENGVHPRDLDPQEGFAEGGIVSLT